jgi:hypothetical protein
LFNGKAATIRLNKFFFKNIYKNKGLNMAQKDYSLLINKTFKHPYSGKLFKIKNITSDGKAELSVAIDKVNIETILNNWEQIDESTQDKTLICG